MTKNIIFTLPAEALEGASEATLLGDFNNWDPQHAPKLQKQKDGSFETAVQLEAGRSYQYRFLLNDGRWVNDYHAQYYTQVPGLYIDNCVINVTEDMPDASAVAAQPEAEPIKPKPVAAKSAAKKAGPKKENIEPAKKKSAAPKVKAKPAVATPSKGKKPAAPAKKADSKAGKKAE